MLTSAIAATSLLSTGYYFEIPAIVGLLISLREQLVCYLRCNL